MPKVADVRVRPGVHLAYEAKEVLAWLPMGSFSLAEFAEVAIGINALGHIREADAMIDYLVTNEVIRPMRDSASSPRWVRCAVAS